MKLSNISGDHIANLEGDSLHSPVGKGEKIGSYLKDQEIFVNNQGEYLGEIINNDRLMFKVNAPHENTNFGKRKSNSFVGRVQRPKSSIGNVGNASTGGYKDVKTPWLD